QVTGAANLTKLGAGTLLLSNAVGSASNYTGQTTIAGGILNAQNGQTGVAAPLGASSAVVVAGTGAALQPSGNLNVPNRPVAAPTAPGLTLTRNLVLYGSGVGGNGALESVYGVNSVTGTIALNGAATIGVGAGMLTQSNVISGPGDLTKVGGGTFALTTANT